MNDLITLDKGQCELSKIGAHIQEDLPFEAWLEIGRTLNKLAGSLNWWMGDWLLFGKSKFGDRARLAYELAEHLGVNEEQLCLAIDVASVVKFETRVAALSWTHHREVISLTDKEQKRWLQLAVENNWTHRDLRVAIRADQCEHHDVGGAAFNPVKWLHDGLRWFKGEERRAQWIDHPREQREALVKDLELLVEIYQKIKDTL